MGVFPAAPSFRSARITALLSMLCAAAISVSARAQSAAQLSPNELRLFVVTDQDRPVPLAEVTIRQGSLRAIGRTDSAGIFRVEKIPLGNWQASVRRIGFYETFIELPVASGENAYTITVDSRSSILNDVNVIDKFSSTSRLSGFEERKAHGVPSAVITREQITKRNPIALSQMFRGMAGLNVADEQGMRYPVASRSSVPKIGAGGQATMVACPMRISVDGVLRPPLSSIDDVNPSDVHGVEVYYGPASLPLQFASFRTNNWCGLVMIWTRDK